MHKIGVFGGTFDPIHIGHLYIANEAFYTLKLDKIIFMPSGNPPHKINNSITDAKIRYNMVKSAIKDRKEFVISDYEVRKESYSYTYETLEYLKGKEGKDAILYFITGCDCLFDLDKWKRPDKILENCKFVVFNRPGYNLKDIESQKAKYEKQYNAEIIFLDILKLDISSTYIRNNIMDGKNVSFFLTEGVKDIIKKEKLYQG
ncbi:nicotinate-nucleotide adenylyltransferase [Clostridium oryzae]|uniref:Probable nicotinate-nucleotide adenylyltransferase n=1 Tax=Clostridium oryzae TaxID=1450648 RepID=A0A1V4IUR4_9CLOT|nr:nicotinate-nucleotide adenylyltransferase [Clostridium oryzae]OPJ63772.1 nicotinate-nucleotide adenylyltransferase [Clostridium oryzae]